MPNPVFKYHDDYFEVNLRTKRRVKVEGPVPALDIVDHFDTFLGNLTLSETYNLQNLENCENDRKQSLMTEVLDIVHKCDEFMDFLRDNGIKDHFAHQFGQAIGKVVRFYDDVKADIWESGRASDYKSQFETLIPLVEQRWTLLQSGNNDFALVEKAKAVVDQIHKSHTQIETDFKTLSSCLGFEQAFEIKMSVLQQEFEKQVQITKMLVVLFDGHDFQVHQLQVLLGILEKILYDVSSRTVSIEVLASKFESLKSVLTNIQSTVVG